MPSAPIRRICTRYTADGQPCLNFTDRHDRWCGSCAGFSAAAPRPGQYGNYWFRPENDRCGWTPAPCPFAPDWAYEVSITQTAQQQFITSHGGTPAQAEAQLRSLLEDLLRSGRIDQARPDAGGMWRLMFFEEGYLLLVSADREAVIAYRTRHAERTWSQYKAGVRSRVAVKRPTSHRVSVSVEEAMDTPEDLLSKRVKKHVMERLRARRFPGTAPLGVTSTAFKQFVLARTGAHVAGPHQVEELLDELEARAITLAAAHRPDRTETVVRDGGLLWTLTTHDDAGDQAKPVLTHVHRADE
ncbi:hypothetical protein [Streptomyces mobaraensis]|uniref:hypothetical protein n=1 Tax=Streptomyces mobaraensis TaxID=35621 RepID=UPI0013DF38EA|nr:hypothetical protein [Streptomyces mobaraensis]